MYLWVSLFPLDDGFKWNDDSSLTFNNWEEGAKEDPEVPLIDTCVALHVASGMWESVSCLDQTENGVVCKTAQSKLHLLNRFKTPNRENDTDKCEKV